MKRTTKNLGKNPLYVCVFVLTCFFINNVHAQNPYLNNANAQLRSIFSQITFPSPNVLFLYERSAKTSDSTFYQNNSPDTLDQELWLEIYDEMYYASHDTTPLKTHVQVENYGYSCGNDTITIGIMDYDWYYLQQNALTSNTFFDFDLVNNQLQDNPTRPYAPFSQSNIFAVAPMQLTSNYLTPTFRIDPYLFFSDINNTPLYNSSSFRLDFGDGTGWHYFDPNVLGYYTVDYQIMGEYEITAEIIGEKDFVLKSSKSKINIIGKAKSNSADEVLDMPGLNIGVYHPCNVDNEKVIIYLEGIDILDMLPNQNRSIDVIYEDMIHNNYIEEVRDFNYAFYVVDWKNSRIDMRFNALYVVNLIEKLKNDYQYSDEQFILIGESMGGVVGRYALTFMESKDYTAGVFSSFFVEALAPGNATYLALHPTLPLLGYANRTQSLVSRMHKTRELITLDSPHQGANVPLGLQIGYKKLMGGLFPGLNFITNLTNQGLGSYAARQMLLYHINGKVNPLSSTSAYLPALEFFTFNAQLALMGDYPKYAKLMALSNGAINGEGQRNSAGNIRTANDVMLNLSKYKEYKLFGNWYPLFDAQLKLNSNPNWNGQVYYANFDFFIPYIQLSWFNISIQTIQINLYNDYENVLNVKPYCVSAGGNLSYSLKNHSLGFGFIPLQSALDYGKDLNMPLNHDIENENINTKLSRTPFDVIIGYPEGSWNQNHLNYRDEGAFNITGVNAVNCNAFSNERYTYSDAADGGLCDIKRGLLNLEIGDEEMYIENWTLNRPALFQAQYDVRVNERNPYYQYPSSTGGALIKKGMYSKEKNFGMTPTASAKFFYNTAGAPPNSIGFSYTNPLQNGLWGEFEMNMEICLNDYSTKRPEPNGNPAPMNGTTTENFMVLVPNPVNGSTVNCNYEFRNKIEKQTIQVFDATGVLISRTVINSKESSNTVQMEIGNIQAGMYFVSVDNGTERLTQKLIVK